MTAAGARCIAHVDLDAFFASVEQLDAPALRGLPLAVGGEGPRSVVAAASYEARAYGVRSAMPMHQARHLCRGLLVRPPRIKRYAEVSERFFDILARYAPRVEGLGYDEAYLDISEPLAARSTVNVGEGLAGPEAAPPGHFADPADAIIARGEGRMRELRAVVRAELGLAVSAGVAPVKFAAKIASDVAKPDGLRAIWPRELNAFLDPLDVGRIWGVGEKRRAHLLLAGLRTIGDVRRLSERQAAEVLGRDWRELLESARGVDRRGVMPDREARSVGAEETFGCDLTEIGAVALVLEAQCEQVARRLVRHGLVAGGVAFKHRTTDFATVSRQARLATPTDSAEVLTRAVLGLLERHPPRSAIRLAGVHAHDLRARLPELPL